MQGGQVQVAAAQQAEKAASCVKSGMLRRRQSEIASAAKFVE